jgi:hypothetical protein
VRSYEQLTKHKVKFEIDELSTRVFLQTPSKDSVLIVAKIKLRFENTDTHDWHMKKVVVTLHNLRTPKQEEISTWILDERYTSGAVEMQAESFEGMLIQAGRLTPWYVYTVTLTGVQDSLKSPDELTSGHFLHVSMQASNQEPLDSSMFVDWERALTKNGAPVLSFGAAAIRSWENRRLRDIS